MINLFFITIFVKHNVYKIIELLESAFSCYLFEIYGCLAAIR